MLRASQMAAVLLARSVLGGEHLPPLFAPRIVTVRSHVETRANPHLADRGARNEVRINAAFVGRSLAWEAEALEASDRCKEAIEKLERAAALLVDTESEGEVLLRLGRCHEKLGQLIEALHQYEAGTKIKTSSEKTRRALAMSLNWMRATVPTLLVTVAGRNIGDVFLYVDQEERRVGEAIKLNPGEHAVRVQLGNATFEKPVLAKPNLVTVITFNQEGWFF